MNEIAEKERLRLIQTIQDSDEFVTEVDGFVYYLPDTNGGILASHHLRWIADELDLRNKALNDDIEEYFRLHPVEVES